MRRKQSQHNILLSIAGNAYAQDGILREKVRVPLEHLCAERGLGAADNPYIQDFLFALKSTDTPTAVVCPDVFVCILEKEKAITAKATQWILDLLLSSPCSYVPNTALVECLDVGTLKDAGVAQNTFGDPGVLQGTGRCSTQDILDDLGKHGEYSQGSVNYLKRKMCNGLDHTKNPISPEHVYVQHTIRKVSDALIRGYGETGGDRKYIPSEIKRLRKDPEILPHMHSRVVQGVLQNLEKQNLLVLDSFLVTLDEYEQMETCVRMRPGTQMPVRTILGAYIPLGDARTIQRNVEKRRKNQLRSDLENILDEKFGFLAAHGGTPQFISLLSQRFPSPHHMARELSYLGIDPEKAYAEFAETQSRSKRKTQPVLRKIESGKRRGNKKSAGKEMQMVQTGSSSELEEGEIR